MRSYKQVRDVLQHVRTFHRRLREYYEDASEQTSNERIELLLEFLSDHEKDLERGLSRYEPQAAEGILNTWMQYVPDDVLERAFAEIPLHEDSSEEEIIDAATRFIDALVDLYATLVQSTEAPRVKELFASLLELEKTRREHFAWSMRDE